jgi:hypothetical protein
MDSSLRNERLPKGPRFASESLDADTGKGPASRKLTSYRSNFVLAAAVKRIGGCSMLLILLIILIILLIGSQPRWPYSRSWGYYPSSGIGVLLLIVIILLILGY